MVIVMPFPLHSMRPSWLLERSIMAGVITGHRVHGLINKAIGLIAPLKPIQVMYFIAFSFQLTVIYDCRQLFMLFEISKEQTRDPYYKQGILIRTT